MRVSPRGNLDGTGAENLISGLDNPRFVALLLTAIPSTSTPAAGLSGASSAFVDQEVQIFSIGVTGDGSSSVNSVELTISDVSTGRAIGPAEGRHPLW